ncbi:nucleotidyltransferase domain-containing protein [Marinospirillum alkaliphilum]|uniref:Predicted nucleotidyltransferase n=1 Tax=Marinospirillum alkaliphilum DSM 21637 TaxID=1122209 RepID=A0A1K1VKM4_9GAMM|nr:nucleotidyltransferase domain-containing protein [Marinospirillum alkaliphilum]SFX25236.1 Predicted nucleotidyltransferase [Marinospirillum alkaliphilum DSM 21637]
MNLQIGLEPHQLQMVLQCFANHPEIEQAMVYGSRAKGNYHQRSDLDLALKGQLNRHQLAQIKLELEDTNLPISIDLLNYQELTNPLLKEHIDRVGITIYSTKECQ